MSSFVAIELLPDHIDIVLMRGGRVVGSRRLAVELPNEALAWRKALRSAAGDVKQAVTELRATKLRAVVLYRSPTQAVDLAGIEVRSAAQAEEAASLDCLSSLSFNMDLAAMAATTIARDSAGENRKTHVVVAADRTDVLDTMIEVVEGASLKIDCITPVDAAITSMVAKRATRRTTPCQAWLYVGELSSFFLIAGDGRVHFGRNLNLGIDTLSRTLTRPIRVRGQEQPVELDLATATAIIHRCGVPRGEQIVYEPLGLTGTQLRPLVQPVLQRYVVELRQSLRFALPDHDMNGLSITLCGPGSTLAGFGELLEEELGVHVKRDEGDGVCDRESPGCPGSELHDAVHDCGLLRALTILPPTLERSRRASELRRWLIAGAAAALLLVVLDGMRVSQHLEHARQYAESLTSQATEDDALQSTRLKLTNAMASLSKLEHDVDHELSACVSFRAVLQEMSNVTPASVRLTNMTFTASDGETVCLLRGYAVKLADKARNGPSAGETELKAFIEKLQASPLVNNVALLNVERSELAGQPAENFQASVGFVSIPPSLKPALVVIAPETEAQP